MSEWGPGEWIAFVFSFAGTWFALWALALSLRKPKARLENLAAEEATQWTYWEQTGALTFRRVLERGAGDPDRVILERVAFGPDSPAARLAAKDFAQANGVLIRIRHTRESRP